MRNYYYAIKAWILSPKGIMFLRCLFGFGLVIICEPASAKDYLDGTTKDMTDTMGGSGMKWMYLIEGVAGLWYWHKGANVIRLFSFVAAAIFINVILKLAGA